MYIPDELIRIIIEYQRPKYPYHDQLLDYITNQQDLAYSFSFIPSIKNVLCFVNERIPDCVRYELPSI